MDSFMLNGKPVRVGTRLEYLEEERMDFPDAPDFVRVTALNGETMTYEGSGVDGEIQIKCVAMTFRHYSQPLEHDDLEEFIAIATSESMPFDQMLLDGELPPGHYAIRFLVDLLHIPDDRLEVCLAELAPRLRAMRDSEEDLRKAIQMRAGEVTLDEGTVRAALRLEMPAIVWIDSGQTVEKVTKPLNPGIVGDAD